MTKKINKIKRNGVIYTPSWIVKKILKLVNYDNQSLIIDPACGDGAFLKEIVTGIIQYGKKNNHSEEQIKNALQNVYGIDIDKKALKLCKESLNALIKDNLGIDTFNWNVFKEDALSSTTLNSLNGKFDFVIGNPPYVRIQNLSAKNRKNIQQNYALCSSGSTDIYIAFFELSLKLLNHNGKLGFITPNSFLKSKTALEFRKLLHTKRYVKSFVDFGSYQVFDNATTYSVISILEKNGNPNNIQLYSGTSSNITKGGTIKYNSLTQDNWILKDDDTLNKIREIEQRGKKLGDIAKISTGIATLADKYFIFKDVKFKGKIATITLPDGSQVDIEKNILKPIIKASTWKGDDQGYFIIFPYEKDKVTKKHKIISENDMNAKYPKTLVYFKSIKNILNSRDKGKKTYPAWYAFGRSQGVDTAFGEKILTSTMNLKPNFIVCKDKNTLFYSGYAVFYDGDLDKLAEKLNTDDMKFYIDNTSKEYQHGYMAYSKSFIENFGVEIE